MTKEYLSITASLIIILAAVPYVIDIVRGHSKPNVVSWFTWCILLTISTAAAFAAHQPRTAFLSLGDLIGTLSILILGLKLGTAKLVKLDVFCQVSAIAGLALWFIFDSPVVAIVAAVIIDAIASAPTMRHAWVSPEEETWQTFLLTAFATVLTLSSLSNYSVASVSFPLYLAILNPSIVAIIIYRRIKTGKDLYRPGKNEAIHG